MMHVVSDQLGSYSPYKMGARRLLKLDALTFEGSISLF
jgi:hypothetical protein